MSMVPNDEPFETLLPPDTGLREGFCVYEAKDFSTIDRWVEWVDSHGAVLRRDFPQAGMMSVTTSCITPISRGKCRSSRRPSKSTEAPNALSTLTSRVR